MRSRLAVAPSLLAGLAAGSFIGWFNGQFWQGCAGFAMVFGACMLVVRDALAPGREREALDAALEPLMAAAFAQAKSGPAFGLPEGCAILRDGSSWFIECQFVDYCAQGDTPAEAIEYFWSGLLETILVNLDHRGKWEPEFAPSSVDLEWREYGHA